MWMNKTNSSEPNKTEENDKGGWTPTKVVSISYHMEESHLSCMILTRI